MRLTNSLVLSALTNRIWALHPEKLEQVAEFVSAKLEGRQIDFEARDVLEGAEDRPFEMRGNVAVIPVTGVIDRRMNLFTSFSGGTSSQMLAKRIRQAGRDAAVAGIVLDIDSPGGSVFAPEEVSDAIAEVRGDKPVVAFTGGLMASAAYWIASAADTIVVSKSADVGSIGVAAVHYDRSRQDDKLGVKRTMVYAGQYKRIASDERPLTDEGKAYLQEQVDDYYSIFVDTVALGRGMDPEAVAATEARTYVGERAVAAGLADRTGTIQTALALASGEGGTAMSDQIQSPATAGDDGLTLEGLKSEHADLVQAVQGEVRDEFFQAGVDAERARVLEILEAGAGADITRTAVAEGKEPLEVYKAMVESDRADRSAAQDDLKASLAKTVQVEGKETEKGAPVDDPDREIARRTAKIAAEDGVDQDEARKRVLAADPELKKRYLDTVQV